MWVSFPEIPIKGQLADMDSIEEENEIRNIRLFAQNFIDQVKKDGIWTKVCLIVIPRL